MKDIINDCEKKMATLEGFLMSSLSMRENEKAMIANQASMIMPIEPSKRDDSQESHVIKNLDSSDDFEESLINSLYTNPTPLPSQRVLLVPKKSKNNRGKEDKHDKKYPKKLTPSLFIPATNSYNN